MDILKEISPILKNAYLNWLLYAIGISFIAYAILMLLGIFFKEIIFFEFSHLPLHFFAIFCTTCIILVIHEKLEKSLNKFDKNQTRILRYILTANTSFKAMGISLKDIHKEGTAFEQMMHHLTDSKYKDVDYKFLFMSPESPRLSEREFEEDRKNESRLIKECTTTRERLDSMKYDLQKAGNRHSFDYQMYNLQPRHSVIIVDDYLVNVIPYLYKKKGSETEGFVSTDPVTVQQYVEEFNLIWNELEAKSQNK
jgi:hypothetical protein